MHCNTRMRIKRCIACHESWFLSFKRLLRCLRRKSSFESTILRCLLFLALREDFFSILLIIFASKKRLHNFLHNNKRLFLPLFFAVFFPLAKTCLKWGQSWNLNGSLTFDGSGRSLWRSYFDGTSTGITPGHDWRSSKDDGQDDREEEDTSQRHWFGGFGANTKIIQLKKNTDTN